MPSLAYARPAAPAAAGHSSGRFTTPLDEEILDSVLDCGRISPIIPRCDEYESVVSGRFGAPDSRVRVLVLGGICYGFRDFGFVEQREVPVLQIDEAQGQIGAILAGRVTGIDGLSDEVGDLGFCARSARTANDDTDSLCDFQPHDVEVKTLF